MQLGPGIEMYLKRTVIQPFVNHHSLKECSHKRRSHTEIAVITGISGFDIQMRLSVGHSTLYRMVLTHNPRLRAFLNKGIIDRRLNCNNSCTICVYAPFPLNSQLFFNPRESKTFNFQTCTLAPVWPRRGTPM